MLGLINPTHRYYTPLTVRDFVTPSNVNLCHSFLASILSRKWLSAGDGYSFTKVFSLGVADTKDLEPFR
ncbi:MAG: hypothetical protein Q8K86_11415, partial [Candidatus Nanopelagicaceae bacterium]|nr:hypothetical protein [Candidatus Nanopelagicaceae bacterium]